jgi:Flp pilus assembly protein TadD
MGEDKKFQHLSDDEFMDALESGDVQPPRLKRAGVDDLLTLERLEKFLMGEITWAQLQGLTVDEAYSIAEFGYSLFQEGRYHDARAIFEGLVVANPYDAYFRCMLGAVYQQLDRVEEAMDEYSTAIELDGEQLHAYVNRGELRMKRGDFSAAMDDLKRAVELDPDGRDEAGVRARALADATLRALAEIEK